MTQQPFISCPRQWLAVTLRDPLISYKLFCCQSGNFSTDLSGISGSTRRRRIRETDQAPRETIFATVCKHGYFAKCCAFHPNLNEYLKCFKEYFLNESIFYDCRQTNSFHFIVIVTKNRSFCCPFYYMYQLLVQLHHNDLIENWNEKTHEVLKMSLIKVTYFFYTFHFENKLTTWVSSLKTLEFSNLQSECLSAILSIFLNYTLSSTGIWRLLEVSSGQAFITITKKSSRQNYTFQLDNNCSKKWSFFKFV